MGRSGITGPPCDAVAGCFGPEGFREAVGARTPGGGGTAGNVGVSGRTNGLAGCGNAGTSGPVVAAAVGWVVDCAISKVETSAASGDDTEMKETVFGNAVNGVESAFFADCLVRSERSPRAAFPTGAADSARGCRQASSRNMKTKTRERIGAFLRSDCPCRVCAIIRLPFLLFETSFGRPASVHSMHALADHSQLEMSLSSPSPPGASSRP